MTVIQPPRGLSSLPRRLLALVGAALLSIVLLPAAAAQADTPSTLTGVGTSDVSDSGLMQNVVEPGFHAAYPQFTFKYFGTATGTAITDAETGVDTPSFLIVHAASLEAAFVAGGYSYLPYGLAIWRNDFILAGPSADPAGVGANAPNDIAQAFARVAAAGASGTATFIARGNQSGTSVAEHQIWALVAANGAPANVYLCDLAASLGGGETPVTSASVSGLQGQPCPGSSSTPAMLPPSGDVPSWYVTTNPVGQGPTVVLANACTGFSSGANSCYVFTDRGTFDYLASGLDAAGSDSALNILTRTGDATPAYEADALINYFHIYIINPTACTACQVNKSAAMDFVNYITSPALQSQLVDYLDGAPADNDTGGPPFVADASPDIATSGLPSVDTGGASVTVSGTITNAEIGYPALADQPVRLDQLVAGVPVQVASGLTDSGGGYSMSFKPSSSGSFEVSTPGITQVEFPNIQPGLDYADTLSPSATAPLSMSVQGVVTLTQSAVGAGEVTVAGALAPVAPDANARVTILERKAGSTGAFTEVGGTSLTAGQTAYAVLATLPAGSYQVEASYSDPGSLLNGTSAAANVTIPAPAAGSSGHTVSFKKVTSKKGKVTVTGGLKPAPTASGAKIDLLALRTTSKGSLKVVGKTSVSAGKTSFTIRAKLKRKSHWILQLEYTQSGQTSSYSKTETVAVH